MPVIQSRVVIGKNEDGSCYRSDITQDVDVMTRQFLVFPTDSATVEHVFSFAGLTDTLRPEQISVLRYTRQQSRSCGPNGGGSQYSFW